MVIFLPSFFVSLPPSSSYFFFRFGRGEYLETQRMVQSLSHLVSWCYLRYIFHSFIFSSFFFNLLYRMISFDIPPSLDHSSSSSPFEIRYRRLFSLLSLHHPWIQIPTRMRCVSRVEITKRVKEIIEEGGEGIMLHKPASPYVHGRSSLLVKLKVRMIMPKQQKLIIFIIVY